MSRRRVAILQSSYIPWKGYFDIIRAVDELVIFDDAQFTKNDWRNRNRIKTSSGTQWLTIPIATSGAHRQRIRDARAADAHWRVKHFKTISQAYARAPYFPRYRPIFEPLWLQGREETLSEVNTVFMRAICECLGIRTRFSFSMDYELAEDRTERLVGVCKVLGATEYLSGPSAKAYLDLARFDAAGIDVAWADYSGYEEYPQVHPPFEHAVSVLDLLFHAGPDATKFMKAL